jgi:DNA polymerase I-like protein with 3'-5' exonuclease and polymerase domains
MHGLFDRLRDQLNVSRLLPTYMLELNLQPITHRMTLAGIGVDPAGLKVVMEDYGTKAEVAKARLLQETENPGLNPDDGNAVLLALQKIGLGLRSTKKEELCQYAHPAVQALREYRKHNGINTFATGILAAIGTDGRIRPIWDAFGAGTGRYTCSNPPFQGLHRNPALRACIIPGTNRVFVSADLAQADVRPLAFASQDPEMLRIFNAGLDFHAETIARLLDKPVAEVTKKEREISKAVVFGVAYGMAPRTLAVKAWFLYGLNWIEGDAREWMNRFFAIYSGLHAWLRGLEKDSVTATECRTLECKRRRLLPSGPDNQNYRFHCLSNMPAQGTIADAVKQAMIAIAKGLHPDDAIVANLHDELIVEAHVDRARDVEILVQVEMERSLAQMLPGVPVKAEANSYRSLDKSKESLNSRRS